MAEPFLTELPKIELNKAEAKNKRESGGQAGQIVGLAFFHPTPAKDAAKKGSKDKSETSLPLFKGKGLKNIDGLLKTISGEQFFSGKKGETALLRFFPFEGSTGVLLVGLGNQSEWNAEMARQAGASIFLAQRKEKLAKLDVNLDSFAFPAGKELPEFLQAFFEGYLLASYRYFDLLKDERKKDFEPTGMSVSGVKEPLFVKCLERAVAMTQAVDFARGLGDRPGNLLTPTIFADLVQKMAKAKGLKCSVLGKKELEREKMGLFLGVAQGSAEEPKLIVLEYAGGKKGEKPLVLVGKGLTFDSGGISLKPADHMEDMKYDMMGGAAVAGIFHAIGELKPKQNVIGFIGATENMPGGRAQKPGDVQRSLTGKTVEIINTDAEGRLVLADVLEYAQKICEPQAIVDFATLTGAVVVALGSVTTGIMGNHQGLLNRMRESSAATGERVWELPLYDEYDEDLKSSYADYRNSGTREAGSSKAGTFLKYFVNKEIPWVHCDIAGSSYHRKDLNYHPHKYGTGVMVRLMFHLVENWTRLK